MNELTWIAEARKYIGLKENTSKTAHNPTILQWLKDMGGYPSAHKAWWAEDETPWCGLFVGHCLGVTKRYVIGDWYRATAWNDSLKMTKLDKPAYGCIVTFTRSGGGHVGFVVGKDKIGNLMVLGGNQNNMVKIAPFAVSRCSGYYWPSQWAGMPVKSVPDKSRYDLPVLASDGKLSQNEA